MDRVLFVLSSHDQMGNSNRKTGSHLAEITHAYEVLRSAGFEIDFVSPKGGDAPLENVDMDDSINDKWMSNAVFRNKIESTLYPEQVMPEQYGAVFYPGGHGVMFDVAENQAIAKVAGRIYDQGGAIGAVCHGCAGLLPIRVQGNEYLLRDREVAAFTNEEQVAVGTVEQIPFLLEDRLIEEGAQFKKVSPFQRNIAISGRLVTGQNPASARAVAEEIRKMISLDRSAFVNISEATIAP